MRLRRAAGFVHFAFADAAFHFDPIRLAQLFRGAQHARGELAVAGEQHETARRVIQSADGKNALGRAAQKMAQRFAAFGIGHRGDDFGRLVQQKINEFVADFGDAACDFDAIALGIGLRSHFGDDRAVDAHLAAANQFFGVAA